MFDTIQKSCDVLFKHRTHQKQEEKTRKTLVKFTEVSSEHALLELMRTHHDRNQSFKNTVWGPILTKLIAHSDTVSFFARNRIVPRMLLETEDVTLVVRVDDTRLLAKLWKALYQMRLYI